MKEMERKGRCNQQVCGGNGNCETCKARIAMENEEAQFDAVSEFNRAIVDIQKEDSVPDQDMSDFDVYRDGMEELELAIDIGTTTLAFALMEKGTGRVLRTVTSANSQRKYGADVISRIRASADGRKRELQECIQKDLLSKIAEIAKECHIRTEKIGRIIIAGNTTMIHMLKGYDCDSLGVFPYTPVNIALIRESAAWLLKKDGADKASEQFEKDGADKASEQFEKDGADKASELLKKDEADKIAELRAEALILPGISTFVGGDIVSGLYACGLAENDEICLFIDLGTNGEIALGNKDKILVTSAAAGPAFEGGNISWGMGSVAGAICSVRIGSAGVTVKTIRDDVPCGICGTGVVEAAAELVNNGIVDETGLLEDSYFDDGFPLAETADGKWITFTQKDIREIQLAKAAIRAGIEILLKRYGITAAQVTKVFLAGGFGYRLEPKQAAAIGILPQELSDKTEAVGNSSLAGAVKYLKDESGDEKLQKIISVSEEVTLANDVDFNEMYLNAMKFAVK